MTPSIFNAELSGMIDQRVARIAPRVFRYAVYASGFAVVAAAALLVVGLLVA